MTTKLADSRRNVSALAHARRRAGGRALAWISIAALAVPPLVGCSGGSDSGAATSSRGGGRRGPSAFPVEVGVVATRRVEYAVQAVGTVDAFEVVQVTARVPGAVERVRFREGDRVAKGDILVEIEPQRYRLMADEAKAALDKARAELAEAEASLKRRETMLLETPNIIPAEELDAWRTRAASARADVAAREASFALAERNANDSETRAPVGGTLQTREVQTGQYVQPGTLLATIVRRDPMLLRFQVPESDALRLARGMTARFKTRETAAEGRARIVNVAGRAEPTTRMVAVTAEVIAPGANLRPGTFAEVTVPVRATKDAVVIPQTAVRPGERGFLAYVIKDGVAKERILSLGLRTPDGLIEVKDGLAPAESLVVRGAEALDEGAKVRVVTPGAAERTGGGGVRGKAGKAGRGKSGP